MSNARLVKPGIEPRHFCSSELHATLETRDQAVYQCTCGKYYRYEKWLEDEEGRSYDGFVRCDEHGCSYQWVRTSPWWKLWNTDGHWKTACDE